MLNKIHRYIGLISTVVLLNSSALGAEQKWQHLNKSPQLDPGSRIGWGRWQGEQALFVATGQTLWAAPKQTGGWKKIYLTAQPIDALAVDVQHEGWWIAVDKNLIGHWQSSKKPVQYKHPEPLIGLSRIGKTLLAYGQQYIKQYKQHKAVQTFYGEAISAAALVQEIIADSPQNKIYFLNESGGLHTQMPNRSQSLSTQATALAACSAQLWFKTDDDTWQRLTQTPLSFSTDNLACANDAIALTYQQSQWQLYQQQNLISQGYWPTATIYDVALMQYADVIEIAIATGSGIYVTQVVLPGTHRPETPPQPPTSQDHRHLLLPLDDVLAIALARLLPSYEQPQKWLRKARQAAWLPSVRIAGDIGDNQSFGSNQSPLASISTTQQIAVIGPNLLSTSEDHRKDWQASISLTWELDKIVYSGEERYLARAWQQLEVDRERRAAQVASLWQTLATEPRESAGWISAYAVLKTILGGVDPLRTSNEVLP